MQHGVDRLPVPPDEQADVRSPHAPVQDTRVLPDLDLGVEPERVDDLLEQLLQGVGRLELLGNPARAVAVGADHRRLPERFFFLRGGRGGGVAERVLPTPASAGSPLGAPRGSPSALPSRDLPTSGPARAPLAGGVGGGGGVAGGWRPVAAGSPAWGWSRSPQAPRQTE